MSQTSEKVQFTDTEQRHWKIWVEGKDRGFTDEQIAKIMRRTTRTIRRLKTKAKQIGVYWEWVESTIPWAQEEFHELHKQIKMSHPALAYIRMARIIERSMVQRVETKEEIKTIDEKRTVDIKALLADYDAVFERVAQNSVREDGAGKPVATPPET